MKTEFYRGDSYLLQSEGIRRSSKRTHFEEPEEWTQGTLDFRGRDFRVYFALLETPIKGFVLLCKPKVLVECSEFEEFFHAGCHGVTYDPDRIIGLGDKTLPVLETSFYTEIPTPPCPEYTLEELYKDIYGWGENDKVDEAWKEEMRIKELEEELEEEKRKEKRRERKKYLQEKKEHRRKKKAAQQRRRRQKQSQQRKATVSALETIASEAAAKAIEGALSVVS